MCVSVSVCVCLRGRGREREREKQCVWTSLCVCARTFRHPVHGPVTYLEPLCLPTCTFSSLTCLNMELCSAFFFSNQKWFFFPPSQTWSTGKVQGCWMSDFIWFLSRCCVWFPHFVPALVIDTQFVHCWIIPLSMIKLLVIRQKCTDIARKCLDGREKCVLWVEMLSLVVLQLIAVHIKSLVSVLDW